MKSLQAGRCLLRGIGLDGEVCCGWTRPSTVLPTKRSSLQVDFWMKLGFVPPETLNPFSKLFFSLHHQSHQSCHNKVPRTLQRSGEPRRHAERRLLILPPLHRAGCKKIRNNLFPQLNCKHSGDPVLGGGDRNSAHAGKKTIKQRIIPKCKDDLEKRRLFIEPTENCTGGKLASNQGD